MERDLVLDKLARIKGGAFFRMKYKTDLPLKAAYRNLGYSAVKYSEVTVRTGVKYDHIARVEVKGNDRENNYVWIIPYRASHNTKTGLDYLNVATCVGNAYPHNKYVVNNTEITAKELKDNGYLIDSYWNRKDGEVRVIKFDNIIEI